MTSPTFCPRRRGVSARRVLLSVARECERRRLPLPAYATLAAALGISPGQISRHMGVLMDAGSFTMRRNGRRYFVESAAL